MTIRPYQPKDFENCRKICYETSHNFDTEKKRQALYNMYCDYYLEFESDTCFVAADENDEAIGYILCADNYDEYVKNYSEHYLGELKKLHKPFWLMRRADMFLRRNIAKKYPAHLHIDILPKGQRQGLGHKLVDALVDALRKKGVNGVFLIVGKGNQKGINFYRKYGFKEYKKVIGGIVFALDIDKA